MAKKNKQIKNPDKAYIRDFKPKSPGQVEYIRAIAENILTICDGVAGTGKAQPLDSIIKTPSGDKLMGELKVGDEIFTIDGTTTKVVNIYPQGQKQVYKVQFQTGDEVECCEEHLWYVNNSHRNIKNKVLDTKTLIEHYTNNIDGNFHIEPSSTIEYPTKVVEIDPYILGVILGDGCITTTSVKIYSNDEEIINYIRELLPSDLHINKTKQKYSYSISRISKKDKHNSLIVNLKLLDLMGKDSLTKFIPKDYIYNSSEIRLEILRGLLDTDGYTDGTNIEYSSCSKQLALDVKEIVHSLGGTCRIVERTPKITYKGKIVTCSISYRCHIKLPNGIVPFKLSRKKIKTPTKSTYFVQHKIVNITPSRVTECQCIEVDHKSRLYLTNNYIPTHNTACSVAAACNALYLKEIKKIVITRPVVETGASMGYLPGTAMEKVYEYMIPIISEIEDFFGEQKAEELLHYKTIDIVPLNFMRGRNLHECYLIVDEAQNCTYEQLKMAVTRIGHRSKCIINGDSTQTDLYHGDSKDFKIFYEKLNKTPDVAVIHLHYQDIVRNPIIGHILERI